MVPRVATEDLVRAFPGESHFGARGDLLAEIEQGRRNISHAGTIVRQY